MGANLIRAVSFYEFLTGNLKWILIPYKRMSQPIWRWSASDALVNFEWHLIARNLEGNYKKFTKQKFAATTENF